MKLTKVKTVKTWTYTYDDEKDLEEHKKYMLAAQFSIEKENALEITYSQTIKESEE